MAKTMMEYITVHMQQSGCRTSCTYAHSTLLREASEWS